MSDILGFRKVDVAAIAAVALVAALQLGGTAGADDQAGKHPRVETEQISLEALSSSSTSSTRRLGIVLVVIDTLRADHLGVYGSDQGLTPNLDALARESLVFDQAIATSSWTKPSVASMMTGRYPSDLGCQSYSDSLPESALTIQEVLQAAGFTTAAISANWMAGPHWGFGQGFAEFKKPNLLRSYPDDLVMLIAEGVTKEALAWIGEHERQPFFLFLHYVDPHDPYLPHPGALSKIEPTGRYDGSRRTLDRIRTERLKLTEQDRERIRYLYAGEVQYTDHWLGELIKGLKSSRLWNDILFVVTADHGEGLWDHGRRGHGANLFEEQIHVPLMVKKPGAKPGDGARIGRVLSLVDLAPMLLQTAGVSVPDAFGERDSAKGSWRGVVFSEIGKEAVRMTMIREGNLKLVQTERSPKTSIPRYQLFELDRDPSERIDRRKSMRAGVDRLRTKLSKWSVRVRDKSRGRPAPKTSAMDPSVLKRLRALGYFPESE